MDLFWKQIGINYNEKDMNAIGSKTLAVKG